MWLGNLSFLPYSFIDLFNHFFISVWIHGYLFHTSGPDPILLWPFCHSNCYSFADWKLFTLSLLPLNLAQTLIAPTTVLLSDFKRWFRLILCIFWLSTRIIPFPRIMLLFCYIYVLKYLELVQLRFYHLFSALYVLDSLMFSSVLTHYIFVSNKELVLQIFHCRGNYIVILSSFSLILLLLIPIIS